jgi:hypothetical protein
VLGRTVRIRSSVTARSALPGVGEKVPVCDVVDEYRCTFAHGEERIFLNLGVGW